MGFLNNILKIFLGNKSKKDLKSLYPIVGKISMDLVAIRCGALEIKTGQEAIFWGSDDMNLRLEALAGKYDKNPYEFLTGVTKRVKRNYIHE